MSSTPIKSSSAATCAEVRQPANIATFPVRDYDLASTLGSGQAFRWRCQDGGWNGVIAGRWVRLRADEFSICAETAGPQAQLHNAPGAPVSDPASFQSHPATRRIGDRRSAVSFGSRAVSRCVVEPASDWNWLTDYLQCDLDLSAILQTFPDDEPMRAAVNACRGLRLLRQEPWECLASFILSSTKQIVQIQQIVALLSERFGEPIPTFPPYGPAFAFPTPERIARATEAELRGCKMGFRAPYLLETARTIASGKLNLEQLREVPVEIAREAL
ncbi:MAG TPA: DNA glycosylase, partial [Candidatus Paceibacterota bacterium]|nr:DNA glycosylase [Candidatus Paceibacterota bacterium]